MEIDMCARRVTRTKVSDVPVSLMSLPVQAGLSCALHFTNSVATLTPSTRCSPTHWRNIDKEATIRSLYLVV